MCTALGHCPIRGRIRSGITLTHKGRVLQSFDLVEEIAKTNARQAIEAAAQSYLSRLYTVEADMPIRFDPPEHVPRRQPEPRYFYNGDGKNHSRTTHARPSFKRFAGK